MVFISFLFSNNGAAQKLKKTSDTADLNTYKNEIGVGLHSFFLGYGLLSKTYNPYPFTFQVDYKRNLGFGILRSGIGGGSFYYPHEIKTRDKGWANHHLFINLGLEKNIWNFSGIYQMGGAFDFVSTFWWRADLFKNFYGGGISWIHRFIISSRSSLSFDAGIALGSSNIVSYDMINKKDDYRSIKLGLYKNLVISYNYSF
ncbi:MAG: hypothetical protein ABEH43_06300 [Flavobacteriales bacterium]